MTQDVVEQLWELIETEPTTEMSVDLEAARASGPATLTAPFEIDDYTRWRLLEGLDDIGITLSHEDDIAAYEATRPSWKPVHSLTIDPGAAIFHEFSQDSNGKTACSDCDQRRLFPSVPSE